MPERTGPESNEAERIPVKLTLTERAATPELQNLLIELQRDADELREDLFKANPYPTAIYMESLRHDDRIKHRLFSLADRVRQFGIHHSDYHVGGALLGVRATQTAGDNPWVVLFDANTKVNAAGLARKNSKKWCAEQYLLDRARNEGVYRVLQLAVVAEPRPSVEDPIGFYEDVSNKKLITLTPCAECRERIEREQHSSEAGAAIVTPETDIATANALHRSAEGVYSYQKMIPAKSLPDFHKSRDELPRDTWEI